MDLLEVGYVARAHGVRGEVRVHLHAAESTALYDVARAFVGGVARAILSARPAGGAVLVAFEGVADRDAADALRGEPVAVARADLPLAEGEYFLADLTGCEVATEAGVPLGRVAEVVRAAQDLLVIHDGDAERLVPIVPELVRAVDVAARRIVVELPEDYPVGKR
ncbi:MAG TPA: ribosome maturation factor RimM [Haliangiales bacterium]|nr:ribosome maturation factor RimM [Haliangiales bacterium]